MRFWKSIYARPLTLNTHRLGLLEEVLVLGEVDDEPRLDLVLGPRLQVVHHAVGAVPIAHVARHGLLLAPGVVLVPGPREVVVVALADLVAWSIVHLEVECLEVEDVLDVLAAVALDFVREQLALEPALVVHGGRKASVRGEALRVPEDLVVLGVQALGHLRGVHPSARPELASVGARDAVRVLSLIHI